MLSNKTLQTFRSELKHEAGVIKESVDFPDKLLRKWIHEDICEVIVDLGGNINQCYRTTGTISITDAAGKLVSGTVEHTGGEIPVTGFTGLDTNAWDSILVVNSDKFYSGVIESNDATTLTLKDGSSIPALSTATVILTTNNNKYSLDLSSLDMLQTENPIWKIADSGGNPIDPIPVDEESGIANDDLNSDKAYYYYLNGNIQFVVGSDKTLSGDITVGYYRLPTEATDNSDNIDLPREYHNIAKQKTIVRILRKKGELKKARAIEVGNREKFNQTQSSLLSSEKIDKTTEEKDNE